MNYIESSAKLIIFIIGCHGIHMRECLIEIASDINVVSNLIGDR